MNPANDYPAIPADGTSEARRWTPGPRLMGSDGTVFGATAAMVPRWERQAKEEAKRRQAAEAAESQERRTTERRAKLADARAWSEGLRARRVAAGVSTAELAAAVGAHPHSVSSWERGRAATDPKLRAAADAYLATARDDPDEGSVARLVRSRRIRVGMSGARLAALSGLDRSTVSRIESGERQPTLNVLYALANALGCRARDLVP